MSFIKNALFGKPSQQQQTQKTRSTSDPVLFEPGQLRTPERTKALQLTTPSLVEQGLGGVDPAERERLKTGVFGDIGLSTKSALANLREVFGRTGIRGGVQGSDVSDILEASIGARGAASSNIEDILKVDQQQKLANLLQLLLSQEPFAVAQRTRQEGKSQGTTTGGSRGLADFVNFNVTKTI